MEAIEVHSCVHPMYSMEAIDLYRMQGIHRIYNIIDMWGIIEMIEVMCLIEAIEMHDRVCLHSYYRVHYIGGMYRIDSEREGVYGMIGD